MQVAVQVQAMKQEQVATQGAAVSSSGAVSESSASQLDIADKVNVLLCLGDIAACRHSDCLTITTCIVSTVPGGYV